MKIKKIKISELKFDIVRNRVLPKGFIVRVQKYKEILKEVDPTSLEETISNFQCDLHPEDELKVWEEIARNFKINIKNNPKWTLKEKRGCFKRLLLSTMSPIAL